MTDTNKQALEVIQSKIKKGNNLNGNYELTFCEIQDIKSALQPKPSVDWPYVEELKQMALTEFMKGREHSKDLRKIAFEIISETFNVLKMKGHLNQGWRDDCRGNIYQC